MASIYDLKPKFQNLLRPVVNKLAAIGVTANQVTVLAIIISVAAGITIYFYPDKQWPLLSIPLVLFLRMALNAIDGMLAREHNMSSSLGAILNELGDVISDTVLYLPLAMIMGINSNLVVLIVVMSIISEMVGVIAIQIGATRRYDGPMGKSDRAFVFGVISLALGLGYPSENWLDYVLIGILILLCVTVVNRAKRALEEVK